MQITREINGVQYSFTLTQQELNTIERNNRIQFAKNIIENYNELVADKSVYINDDLLLEVAEEVENRSMDNNGEIEWDVLKEHGIIIEEEIA